MSFVTFFAWLLLALCALFGFEHQPNYTHKLTTSLRGVELLEAFNLNTVDYLNGSYVEYVNRSVAAEQGLAYPLLPDWLAKHGPEATSQFRQHFSDEAATIETAWWSTPRPMAKGRQSVWLSSKETCGSGTMLVASFTHVPIEHCGVYPELFAIDAINDTTDAAMIFLYRASPIKTRNLLGVALNSEIDCSSESAKLRGATCDPGRERGSFHNAKV